MKAVHPTPTMNVLCPLRGILLVDVNGRVYRWMRSMVVGIKLYYSRRRRPRPVRRYVDPMFPCVSVGFQESRVSMIAVRGHHDGQLDWSGCTLSPAVPLCAGASVPTLRHRPHLSNLALPCPCLQYTFIASERRFHTLRVWLCRNEYTRYNSSLARHHAVTETTCFCSNTARCSPSGEDNTKHQRALARR